MNLEYFISSLPALSYGQPAQITEAAFREACVTGLDGAVAASVAALLDGSPFAGGASSAWVEAWNGKEAEIRLAVARRRAARLGVPPPETLACVMDTRIEPAVNAAFEEVNPLRREEALDRLRWQLADEMQGVQPFSENVIYAYAVKLRLVLRFQSLSPEAGKIVFSQLTTR